MEGVGDDGVMMVLDGRGFGGFVRSIVSMPFSLSCRDAVTFITFAIFCLTYPWAPTVRKSIWERSPEMSCSEKVLVRAYPVPPSQSKQGETEHKKTAFPKSKIKQPRKLSFLEGTLALFSGIIATIERVTPSPKPPLIPPNKPLMTIPTPHHQG